MAFEYIYFNLNLILILNCIYFYICLLMLKYILYHIF